MKRFAIAVVTLVLLLAIAGSGAWYWGASRLHDRFGQWFAMRQADGWTARYDDFSIRGYPTRFDATWRGLSLADPASGLAVKLPHFQLSSPSWKLGQVSALAPQDFQMATPYARFPIEDDDLRAALSLDPSQAMQLQKASLSASGLALGGEVGMTVTGLDMGVSQDKADPRSYTISLNGTDLTLPVQILNRISALSSLPKAIGTTTLAAQIGFDRPWDRRAWGGRRPQPRHIDLKQARIVWGTLILQATGRLDVDAQGRATGEIALMAENWRQILQIAADAGAITPDLAKQASGVLGFMAGLGGDSNTLKAKVTLRDGAAWLGILPLGRIPPLILR